MKIYIALGGIGCRMLKEFARAKGIETDRCYYFDSDPMTFKKDLEQRDHAFWVRGVVYGTGATRAIGRNIIRHAIFSGGAEKLFAPVKQMNCLIEPVIVTTSFGGFGSSAAGEMADFVQSLFWDRLDRSNGYGCSVIAVSDSYWRAMMFRLDLLPMYSMNTAEMLTEMESRKPLPADRVAIIGDRGMFLPSCRLFLVDVKGRRTEDLPQLLAMSPKELQALDCREEYRIKPKKRSPAVFISYSSKDQLIADMLVKQLADLDVGCWIANKSIDPGSYPRQIMQGIREAKVFAVLISRNAIASQHVKNEIDRAFARLGQGVKIMPFLIDDSPLDDELQYYLCRQEMYSGKEPPLVQRIREFAEKISDTLE